MQPLFTVCLLTFAIGLTLRTPDYEKNVTLNAATSAIEFPSQEDTRDPAFYATNFQLNFLTKDGKAQKFPVSSEITEIDIRFEVEGVEVEPGERWIYVVIVDRTGQTVINPVLGTANSGGTFTVDGIKSVYTTRIRMNYLGQNQMVLTRYQVGESFPAGKLSMYFYCEGKQIGRKDFFVSN